MSKVLFLKQIPTYLRYIHNKQTGFPISVVRIRFSLLAFYLIYFSSTIYHNRHPSWTFFLFFISFFKKKKRKSGKR